MSEETKIKGRLVKIKELETLKTKKGTDFKKQEIVIDQNKSFNSQLCIVFLSQNVQQVSNLKEGNSYEFYINVSSREHNDKHYTQVDCWKTVELKIKKEQIKVGEKINDLPF